MGCCERGRVVQPVADHQDAAALGAQAVEMGDLVLGRGAGDPVRYPDARCQRRHGALGVSRQQRDRQAGGAEGGYGLGGVGTGLVLEEEGHGRSVADAQPGGGAVGEAAADPFAPAELQELAVEAAGGSEARMLDDVGDGAGRDARGARGGGDGA